MQPGDPGQDPYGQQPQDPNAGQYPDPYGQPPGGSYGPAYHEQRYADPYAQQPPPPAAPGYPAGPHGPPSPPQNNNLGLIAMIVGIASIPFAFCCTPPGIAAGIAGVVLGVRGQKKADQGLASNRGQATAGLVTGAVGIVLNLISAVLGAALTFNGMNVT